MKTYSFAGLRIRSPIPLSGWPVSENATADVNVSLGPVRPGMSSPVMRGSRFQGAPGRWLAWPYPGCRLEVLDGDRIVLELDDGFPDDLARSALEQIGIVAALNMRGALPLHGSAVEHQGRAWIFLGPTRVGKSSLAASLKSFGLHVFCDDLCAVSSRPGPRLLGGTAVLKIPSELCLRIGMEETLSLEDGRRGRRGLLIDASPQESSPIGGVFLLSQDRLASSPELHSLSATQAVQALLSHSQGPNFARALGVEKRYWLDCVELVRQRRFLHLAMPKIAGGDIIAAEWLLEQGHLGG